MAAWTVNVLQVCNLVEVRPHFAIFSVQFSITWLKWSCLFNWSLSFDGWGCFSVGVSSFVSMMWQGNQYLFSLSASLAHCSFSSAFFEKNECPPLYLCLCVIIYSLKWDWYYIKLGSNQQETLSKRATFKEVKEVFKESFCFWGRGRKAALEIYIWYCRVWKNSPYSETYVR